MYCGELTYARSSACERCATIKAHFPDGLGDDEILVEIMRRLAAQYRHRLALNERLDTKKRRAANRRAVERRHFSEAAE